jgi:oligoribonuclease (3'-5' exoribonuclease)
MTYHQSAYGRAHGMVPPEDQSQFMQLPPQGTAYHRWLSAPAMPMALPGGMDTTCLSQVFNANNKYNATWLFCDLECTQLEFQARDFGILEIAAAVVDNSMQVVDTFHVIINQPATVIAAASKWCKRRFCSRVEGGNDLFAQCEASTITERQAGIMLEEFILKHAKTRHVQPDEAEVKRSFFKTAELEPIDTAIEMDGAEGGINDRADERQSRCSTGIEHYRIMLAGCSVYFDRAVLLHKYPHLKNLIGHKTIELSSLLEISRKWRPDLLRSLPPAQEMHRALVDVLESVSLLKWFWRSIIVGG